MEAKISLGGDFKNNDLHPIRFDRGGNRPYYTRPMAPGLPDRVDCEQLALETAVLERVYPLGEMPRVQDLLSDSVGSVRARFAFAKVGSGRAGAAVAIEASPHLICQRCLQGFTFAICGNSEVEFAGDGNEASGDPLHEVYAAPNGLISLQDLAEEELLLALPIVAACDSPQTCGRAPVYADAAEARDTPGNRSRPFTGLQDLLKKTLD